MKTFQFMVAALAAMSTNAFAPVPSSSNGSTTALQAGLLAEGVRLATVAGAVATVILADRSGTSVAASSPVPSASTASAAPATVDISVPYDAAAMLAYDASPKDMDFESFKAKYVQDTVAMIKSKQKQLVSA